MSEWLKEPVSKTGVPLRVPRVRISASPLMYCVYVIWSDKLKKRYVGSSEDDDKRLKQHNIGKTPFTSRGTPWSKIHVENYNTVIEARGREKFLKSGKGREWLDKMYPDLSKKEIACS